MPKLLHVAPKYRPHKPSGQAVVTLDGRHHYLGSWRSKASKAEYDRLTGEWLADGRRLSHEASDPSIAELVSAYWKFAQAYDQRMAGRPGPYPGSAWRSIFCDSSTAKRRSPISGRSA